MDDPEGNLVIVERVVHENQRRFPDWEHGWGGTAHVLTSTQDGAVEQKEQKEVKYIGPFIFDDIGESAECDFIWEHRVRSFSDSGIAVLKVYQYSKV